MPPVLGDLIVLLALAIVIALAVRSLWRDHGRGGSCNGGCAGCAGCHGQKEKGHDTPL